MTTNPPDTILGDNFLFASMQASRPASPEEVVAFRDTVDVKKNGILPLKRFYQQPDAAAQLFALDAAGPEGRELVGKALLHRKHAESWEKGPHKAAAAVTLLGRQPQPMQAEILKRPYMVGNWVEQNADVAPALAGIIGKLDKVQQLAVLSVNNTLSSLVQAGQGKAMREIYYQSLSEASRRKLEAHDSFEVSYGIELVQGSPRPPEPRRAGSQLSTSLTPSQAAGRNPA